MALVRRLQRPGQNVVFTERVGSLFRINARTSQVKQSTDAGITRGGDDVHAYLHVLQKEIRRPCHIGLYPADHHGATDEQVRRTSVGEKSVQKVEAPVVTV